MDNGKRGLHVVTFQGKTGIFPVQQTMNRIFYRDGTGLNHVRHEIVVTEEFLQGDIKCGAVTHDRKQQMALGQVNEGLSQMQAEIRVVGRFLSRLP